MKTSQILYDAVSIKKNDEEKLIAENLLRIACNHAGLEPTKIIKPSGARKR
jgi:hypothetical protein